jgi:hypothetical protein
MNGYDPDDDRGVPPVDYETAEADAIAEAMPMIEFWLDAKQRFGDDIGEFVRDAFADVISVFADEHAARVDDHPDTVDDIYRAIFHYGTKDGQK